MERLCEVNLEEYEKMSDAEKIQAWQDEDMRKLKVISKLQEALTPFVEFLNFIEAARELDGDKPLTEHMVVVQVSGPGSSDALHVSDLWKARDALYGERK